MSKDNVKKMFAKIEKDMKLTQEYIDLLKEHGQSSEKIIMEKLVEFGKKSGFIFSSDDLIAARAELMDKKNSNAELADDDLEKVAGGGITKAGAVIMSTVTAGIWCALTSIKNTEENCKKLMTTSDPNCKNT